MTRRRLGELARGLGGFVGLVVLVVGVPAALALGVGWPLPHAVPSVTALHRLLTGRYHPNGSFYFKVVAIVAWIAWLEVATCAAAEIRAVVAGRRAWQVRFAGPLQPFVAGLVAAVVLALPPSGIKAPAQPQPLVVALSGMTAPRHNLLSGDRLLDASTTPAHLPVRSTDRDARRRTDAIRITVQPRETLWGLAERYLGNPLDWREIFEMNVGKPQAGGGALTDPSMIRPGWVLELPPRAAPHVPAEHRVDRHHEPPSTNGKRGRDEHRRHSEAPAPHSTNGHAPGSDQHRGSQGNGEHSHARPRSTQHSSRSEGALVELPSGAVVSTSFLAGVAAAVAIGRLRRRRGYRPRRPVAGWSGRGWEPPPVLAQLLRAGQGPPEDDDLDEDADPSEAPVHARAEVDVPLGRALVGQRGDEPVVIDIAGGGLALDGPGAEGTARAVVAEVVTRYLPGQLECVVESALWPDLLSGVSAFPGLRSARSLDDFLREAEVELIRRVRLLEDEELADLSAYWGAHPEDAMPVLLVVCRNPAASIEGRVAGILDLGQRVGIGALIVGASSVARTAATVDDLGGVEVTSAPALQDVHLISLYAEEATAALLAVGDARRVEDEPAAEEPPVDPPPAPVVDDLPSSSAEAPVRVELLGSLRIEVAGEEVRTGMRAKARELLAWFCCHPEGGTPEAVVEASGRRSIPARWGSGFGTRSRAFAGGSARSRAFPSCDCSTAMGLGTASLMATSTSISGRLSTRSRD